MERIMIIYTFHRNGNLNIFAKLDLKGFICTLGDGKMAVICIIIIVFTEQYFYGDASFASHRFQLNE